MRLNRYSALTIFGIVMFATSITAVLLSIGIADYLDSFTASILFCSAILALLKSTYFVARAFRHREPIITLLCKWLGIDFDTDLEL